MQRNRTLLLKTLTLVFLLIGLQSLLPFHFKHLGLITGLLVSFIVFFQTKKIYFSRLLLINSILFFVYLISLFNSENTLYVWKYLETGLPLLAFPIFFSLISGMQFSKKEIRKFLSIFSQSFFIGTVIYSLVIIAYFAHLGYFTGKASYGLCMSYIRVHVWGFYGHPIYVSIYMIIAVFFSIYLFQNKLLHIIILIFGNILLIGLSLFLSRKAVLLSGLVSLIFYLYHIINSKKLKTAVFLFIIFVFIGGVVLFPNTTHRFKELFNTDTYLEKPEVENSTQIRLSIYKCALQQIPDAGIFGFGIGDIQQHLNQCYRQVNPQMLHRTKSYNTHNVYLNFILATGYFGFFVFLFFLYTLYKTALNSEDWLFFSVLIFFTLNFFTENILSRQDGVVIFTFLINFYTFKYLIDSETLCKNQ